MYTIETRFAFSKKFCHLEFNAVRLGNAAQIVEFASYLSWGYLLFAIILSSI